MTVHCNSCRLSSRILLNQTTLAQKRRNCKHKCRADLREFQHVLGRMLVVWGRGYIAWFWLSWLLVRYPSLKEIIHSRGCIKATQHSAVCLVVTTVPWLVGHSHLSGWWRSYTSPCPSAQPKN